MKKQLLIGSALLAAISVYSQNGRVKNGVSGVTNMSEKLAQKYAVLNNPSEPSNQGAGNVSPVQESDIINTPSSEAGLRAAAASTVQWAGIGGSMNIYGQLVSQSKSLTFVDNLNAVTFIHRKGTTYTANPFNTNGAILARVTRNWGATWDSTCIWSSDDAVRRARYPQGGIYNPPGNSNIDNAYAVGMGPVTSGAGWTGSWYASKQLGTANYNNTASAAPGAMQFIANTPPYNTGLAKHDFSRLSFSSTDDGAVRSLAGRYTGLDGNSQPNGFKGAAIIKGNFNAGVFTWTSDTIIPSVLQSTVTSHLWSQPIMAWNEAGTHGYVVFIGAAPTATGSNRGWQPIVYKTTNSGGSWAQIASIDFSAPTMSTVLQHIYSTSQNTAEVIPFFNIGEGYDCVVDANNKLHFVATVVGTSNNHNDSLNYTYSFGNQGMTGYAWRHTPGERPYIYDFVGDGSGPWSLITVDSMATEGAPSSSTAAGYTSNPWNISEGSKVTSDSRIQVGRDVSGQYIVYSWAESDTAFTPSQQKWNTLPNIKARCLLASIGGTMTLSPTEINVTRPTQTTAVTNTINPNIANRAWFHYMSSTGIFINCVGSNTVQLRMPFTVTNSNPLNQVGENKNWFTAATLEFEGLTTCTGFQQSLAYNVGQIEVFPNPAHSNATIAVELTEKGNVTVNVYNMVGQLLKTINTEGQLGSNKMNLDLEGLNAGIYMVNVKVGNTTSTKKLIIE